MIVKRVCLECNIPQRTETAVRCGRPRSVWPDLKGRAQCPCGLRRRSATARLLETWVRILLRALMFVSCGYCVLCRQRSVRRADHSFRAVLLGVECLVACDLDTSTARRFRAKLRHKEKYFWWNWTAFDNVLCSWHLWDDRGDRLLPK